MFAVITQVCVLTGVDYLLWAVFHTVPLKTGWMQHLAKVSKPSHLFGLIVFIQIGYI